MKRKLIEQGGTTLMTSLPSKWLKKFGLKKGDEIDLNIDDQSIIIGTQQDSYNKSKINLTGMHIGLAWRFINSAYKKGVDELEISFDENMIKGKNLKDQISTLKFLNQVTDDLIGMEIINHGKSYCTIKEISSSSSEDFTHILNRIILNLMEISLSNKEYFETKDQISLEGSIFTTERNINRLTKYCIRILNKKNSGVDDRLKYFKIIHDLEIIGDILTEISKKVLSNKTKKETKELILLSHEIMSELNRFIKNPNKNNFIKLYNIKEDIKVNINADEFIFYNVKNIANMIIEIGELLI
ncbi:AbrB/MazE/SpoVT family DNA-binding domain-containing protein [Nanoarchaeota archaeon]